LIQKDLVEKQAAFLLVSLRQKILMTPQSYARRILEQCIRENGYNLVMNGGWHPNV
jgi:hypothetical protein